MGQLADHASSGRCTRIHLPREGCPNQLSLVVHCVVRLPVAGNGRLQQQGVQRDRMQQKCARNRGDSGTIMTGVTE